MEWKWLWKWVGVVMSESPHGFGSATEVIEGRGKNTAILEPNREQSRLSGLGEGNGLMFVLFIGRNTVGSGFRNNEAVCNNKIRVSIPSFSGLCLGVCILFAARFLKSHLVWVIANNNREIDISSRPPSLKGKVKGPSIWLLQSPVSNLQTDNFWQFRDSPIQGARESVSCVNMKWDFRS